MSFADEIAEVVHELLDPGEDTVGEDIVVRRPAGSYDTATRKRTASAPTTQTLRGTIDDPGLTPAGVEGSLAERHDRIAYCAPLSSGGFEPAKADEVVAEGRTYTVDETAHVIKQGVPILWVMGLSRA